MSEDARLLITLYLKGKRQTTDVFGELEFVAGFIYTYTDNPNDTLAGLMIVDDETVEQIMDYIAAGIKFWKENENVS